MVASARARNLHSQTARHNGRTLPRPTVGPKSKFHILPLSLLEAWFAVRGLSILTVSEASGLDRKSLYNLIEDPERSRDSTADAIAAATANAGGKPLTGAEVKVLASRAVKNPDRVSDEIDEALASVP